jgi:N-[(2S)-2-amino-2-carboxyethyl]-L-glutamate dehydrogenase
MFNPMGMAVFDIAIGAYYYKQALERNIGIGMPD